MRPGGLPTCRHPGLPYVVDHFNVPGQGQYLILEYVDGKDLQSLIKPIWQRPAMGASGELVRTGG